MGDMREVFDDFKAYKAERKAHRYAANLEALTSAGIGQFKEQSKNVFRYDTDVGAVMYYPATNCWQHKGKTCRGDVQAFINWFKTFDFRRPE